MATDFTYDGKQIVSGGPLKPNGKDMPNDARTRVDCYADIATIPNPYVGLKITVKVDETNNNKMTDYIVKSLKANSIGLANSLIDEVEKYVDYLGASSNSGNVSQEDIKAAVNGYFEENPVQSGATAEQEQQLTTAYNHSQSLHVQFSDLPIKTSQLANDSSFVTTSEMNNAIGNIVIGSGNFSMRNIMDGEIFILGAGTNETYGNIVVSTTSLSFNEDSSSTFTVKLDSAPSNSQTINISVDNENCTVSSSSLTFTSSNYSTEQTITVNGVHSSGDYNNTSSIITLSSDGVSSKEISVILINIDSQPSEPTVTYGNIVLSNTNLAVNENASNTFTVKLDKAPTSNQVVNVAVNNSYCTVNPSSLTFTPSNYSTTQTVTVNGVHDSSNYTNKTSVITLSSTSVTNKTVNVTINNIDEQPSETIPVQSITLNKTESTLNVGDSEQLTVSINPTNATNQNISWSSSDDRKATVVNGLVTAVANGNATITATSEDGNKTASCNFTINEVVVETPKPLFSYTNLTSSKTLPEEYNSIIVDNNNFTLFGRIIKNASSPNRACYILKTSENCYKFERTWQSKLGFTFYGTAEGSINYPTAYTTSEDDTVVYAFVRNNNKLSIYINNILQTNYDIRSGFTFNSVDGMTITIGDASNTLDLYFYNSNLDENQLTSIYNTIYGGK